MPPLRQAIFKKFKLYFSEYPIAKAAYWIPYVCNSSDEPMQWIPSPIHPFILYLDILDQALDMLTPPTLPVEHHVEKLFEYLSYKGYLEMEDDYVIPMAMGHLDLNFLSESLKQIQGPIVWRAWKLFGKHFVKEVFRKWYCPEQTFILADWITIGKEIMGMFYTLSMPDYFFKEPEECSICLSETFSPHITPCGHLFHDACIKEWKRKTCPYCRAHM